MLNVKTVNKMKISLIAVLAGSIVGLLCHFLAELAGGIVDVSLRRNIMYFVNSISLWLLVPVLISRMYPMSAARAVGNAHLANFCTFLFFYAGRVQNTELILMWFAISLVPVTIASLCAYFARGGVKPLDAVIPLCLLLEPVAPKIAPILFGSVPPSVGLEKLFHGQPPLIHLVFFSLGLVGIAYVLWQMTRGRKSKAVHAKIAA